VIDGVVVGEVHRRAHRHGDHPRHEGFAALTDGRPARRHRRAGASFRNTTTFSTSDGGASCACATAREGYADEGRRPPGECR
jgi:hypothetical protein